MRKKKTKVYVEGKSSLANFTRRIQKRIFFIANWNTFCVAFETFVCVGRGKKLNDGARFKIHIIFVRGIFPVASTSAKIFLSFAAIISEFRNV